MKALLIGLLTLASANSFAATYGCEISILKNGKEIATVSPSSSFTSTELGTISSVTLNKKKNILGKETERNSILLEGIFINSRNHEDAKLDAKIVLQIFKYGQGLERLEIGNINGYGNFEINERNGEYEILGACLHSSAISFNSENALDCN